MYTVNPKRLTVKAELEMEDGQVFNFEAEQTDFSDTTFMLPFDTTSNELYEKMDEFTLEDDDEDDYEPMSDEEDFSS